VEGKRKKEGVMDLSLISIDDLIKQHDQWQAYHDQEIQRVVEENRDNIRWKEEQISGITDERDFLEAKVKQLEQQLKESREVSVNYLTKKIDTFLNDECIAYRHIDFPDDCDVGSITFSISEEIATAIFNLINGDKKGE
jgi:small-conductance mechanosensitive channel